MSHYRLGTIGYAYKDWRGPFYLKGVKQADWLSYYAARFPIVEMNTTFHATPSSDVIERWCAAVPETFRFAVKVGKYVTHDVPLRHAVEPLREFVAAMQPFGERLGPLVLQLPPWCGIEQFADFRVFIANLPPGPRYAVEFRSPAWLCEQTYRVLTEYGVALIGSDHEEHPEQAQVRATTDFLYLRLVGKHGRYPDVGREVEDPTEKLRTWLERIRAVERDGGCRDTWLLCGNDFAGHAPASLRRFATLAGIELPQPEQAPRQTSLFDL